MLVPTYSLCLTLLLQPAWTLPEDLMEGRVDSEHFTFHYMDGLGGLAEDLAAVADGIRAAVLHDLGTDGPDHTRVVVAGSTADLRRVVPGARIPSWAVGLAFPRQNLILIRARSPTGGVQDLGKVFHHEWAHIALDHAVEFRKLPRWFREGFAIFRSGEWSFGRTRSLAGGVLSGRLFSLADLEEQFPRSPLDVELAYAQSIDFVSFLLGEYGRRPFHRLVQLLRKDWPFFLAIEEAYDDGLFAIEEAWHQDLKMRFTWIPLLTGTAFVWFLATLVFITAYVRKRRNRMLALASLDAEDDEPPPPLDPQSP